MSRTRTPPALSGALLTALTSEQKKQAFLARRRRARRRRITLVLAGSVGLLWILGQGFLWPWWQGRERFHKAVQRVQTLRQEVGKTEGVTELQITTQDDKNRPVVLRARHAQEIQGKPAHWVLENPRGQIRMEEGQHHLEMTGAHGLFDQNARHLDLQGQVEASDTVTGDRMTTEHMHVNMATRQASGNKPVQGAGPSRAWAGQGFRYDWGQSHLDLYGPATLVLQPAGKEKP